MGSFPPCLLQWVTVFGSRFTEGYLWTPRRILGLFKSLWYCLSNHSSRLLGLLMCPKQHLLIPLWSLAPVCFYALRIFHAFLPTQPWIKIILIQQLWVFCCKTFWYLLRRMVENRNPSWIFFNQNVFEILLYYYILLTNFIIFHYNNTPQFIYSFFLLINLHSYNIAFKGKRLQGINGYISHHACLDNTFLNVELLGQKQHWPFILGTSFSHMCLLTFPLSKFH